MIVGGFRELGPDSRLFNSAALVDASGIGAVYRKAHLWDAEKLVFTPGASAPPVVDLPAGRVSVMICYDLSPSGSGRWRWRAPISSPPR